MHEKIQTINKPIEEFTNAWNRSNSKYFANLFIDDDEWTDVLGQHVRGKDQIKRLHEYSFKSVLKIGTLITRSKRIRLIRNSLVAIGVEWKSTGNKSPDGKLLTSRCGLPDLIVALENNIHDCKIILRHIMDYTTTYSRSDLIHDHMTINGIEGHEI